MSNSPRNQPTVAATNSLGAWVLVAAIAGVLAAWAITPYLFPERPDRVTVVPPPAPAHAAPVSSQVAAAQPPPSPAPLAAAPQATAVAPVAMPSLSADDVPPVMAGCDFAISQSGMQLPADFRVLAAGGYGGRELGFQIDQSGHGATQIDVVVSGQEKPVALMLGAYEPTVWNVSWATGTRIVAVYVGGYHTQRVAGLPKNVPLLVSSYEQKSACPYFYLGGEGLSTINAAARRVFGRPVDMVYPSGKDGTAFVGSGPIRGIESSRETTVDSFRDRNAPLAGQPGIEDAIRRGLLRRAGPTDIGLWARVLAEQGRDTPPVAGNPSPPRVPENLYIVQGDFTYPSGLYGAHAVMFLVPPGVPRPGGNPGHSAVFELH
jgi:hypothetical protein